MSKIVRNLVYPGPPLLSLILRSAAGLEASSSVGFKRVDMRLTGERKEFGIS